MEEASAQLARAIAWRRRTESPHAATRRRREHHPASLRLRASASGAVHRGGFTRSICAVMRLSGAADAPALVAAAHAAGRLGGAEQGLARLPQRALAGVGAVALRALAVR